MGYVLRYAIVYMTCERERECVFCAALLLNQQAVASSIEIFFPKRRDYLSSVAGVFVMDQLVCTDMLYFLHS